MEKQKGQIGTGLIVGWGVALAIALVGGWLTQNNITDAKIESVRMATEVKISLLQADITSIKINTALVCQSLKLNCK